eukprot:6164560-Prymnesium_polylepis.1
MSANKGHLNLLEVGSVLVTVITQQPQIADLFQMYVGGSDVMNRSSWMAFFRAEQLEQGGKVGQDNEQDASLDGDSGDILSIGRDSSQESPELLEAERVFERWQQEGRGVGSPEALSLQQFALQLLGPHNDAVAPPAASGRVDWSRPLTHYWTATSHNSCTPFGIELKIAPVALAAAAAFWPLSLSLVRSPTWQTLLATSSRGSRLQMPTVASCCKSAGA